MNTAERLIDRLEGVRQVRADAWIAKCCAHDDRSPSLSIRELDDGRLLVHCHAGCPIGDVLAAIGLELADLYAAPLSHRMPPLERERLARMRREDAAEIRLAVARGMIRRGERLSDADVRTLRQAITTLGARR